MGGPHQTGAYDSTCHMIHVKLTNSGPSSHTFPFHRLRPLLSAPILINSSPNEWIHGSQCQTQCQKKKIVIVSHDLWPQQSLARDHVQHTALYLCALSVENDPFSAF
jgi:hypothetical protein